MHIICVTVIPFAYACEQQPDNHQGLVLLTIFTSPKSTRELKGDYYETYIPIMSHLDVT